MKRFQCPSLNKPMETGDGLLIRLPPINHSFDHAQWQWLMQCATQGGNGIVEVTQRGNLQLRGFDHASARLFIEQIASLYILPRTRIAISCEPDIPLVDACSNPFFRYASRASSRVLPASSRNTVGHYPVVYQQHDNESLGALAQQLDAWLEQTGLELAPKCSVVIEHAGEWGYSALPADIRLRLQEERYWLGVGGTARQACWYEVQGKQVLLNAAKSLLSFMAELGPYTRGREAIGQPGFEQRIQSSVGAANIHKSIPAGIQSVDDQPFVGRAGARHAMIALPFGASDAQALSSLGEVCRHAAVQIRLLPQRRLLLVGTNVDQVLMYAAQAGYITDKSDVRQRIFACQGAPRCTSAHIETRELAAETLARLEKVSSEDDVSLHISGCPKGCAHPAPAALTLVGLPKGEDGKARMGIVRQGCADATPEHIICLSEDSDCDGTVFDGTVSDDG